MRTRALLVVGALVACRDRPVAVAPPVATAPPASAAPSPPAPPQRARGDCTVAHVTGELLGSSPEPVVCAAVAVDATHAELSTARGCVLDAARAKKPFSILIVQQGIDSRVENGIVGTATAGEYRLYWIDYDGCPSGCGDGDPRSMTRSCDSIRDSSSNGRVGPPIALSCEGSVVVAQCSVR